MTCNTERNAKIIALRKGGMYPWEIAAELGVSRNTVIGVCNRAGLAKPGNPDRSPAMKLKAQAGEYRTGRPKTPKPIRIMVLNTAKEKGVVAAARQWGFAPLTVYNWRREMAA